MDLKVRGIDIAYDDLGEVHSVNIRFDSNENGEWLNGSVKITEAEYDANVNNFAGLKELAVAKLQAKVNL